MNTIRHTALMLALATVMALPAVARAAEDIPETPVAGTEQATPAPMAGFGMGPGTGMGPGPMHGEHCRTNQAGRSSDATPCMMGPNKGCQMAGGNAMTDRRIDALEKRVDMLQMVMEMMMRQSAGGSQ
ncbi:MAG: hypothetical protein GC183_08300 [Thiobacillus sp.]|nr:hypothetical protein [Thiobacillus sp.]